MSATNASNIPASDNGKPALSNKLSSKTSALAKYLPKNFSAAAGFSLCKHRKVSTAFLATTPSWSRNNASFPALTPLFGIDPRTLTTPEQCPAITTATSLVQAAVSKRSFRNFFVTVPPSKFLKCWAILGEFPTKTRVFLCGQLGTFFGTTFRLWVFCHCYFDRGVFEVAKSRISVCVYQVCAHSAILNGCVDPGDSRSTRSFCATVCFEMQEMQTYAKLSKRKQCFSKGTTPSKFADSLNSFVCSYVF